VQSITFLAISLAALTTQCRLTAYHARSIFALGMASTITSTLTLLHARRHLFQHTALRNLRIALMTPCSLFWMTTGQLSNNALSQPVGCAPKMSMVSAMLAPSSTVAGPIGLAIAVPVLLLFFLTATLALSFQASRLGRSIEICVTGGATACFVYAGRLAWQLQMQPSLFDVAVTGDVHGHGALGYDFRTCAALPLLVLLVPLFAAATKFTQESRRQQMEDDGPDVEAGESCKGTGACFEQRRLAENGGAFPGRLEPPTIEVSCLPSAIRGVGALASGILLHPFRVKPRKSYDWSAGRH
jgi:hypothetical protein